MKTMKKTILCAAAALMALSASAQDYLLDNPANRPYVGLRASYDLSCPGKVKTGDLKEKVFGIGSGVSLGLIYNQPLVANLFLEPGISFYYNTESIDPDVLDGFKVKDAFEHRSMRKFGMQVPVQFGYHFDFAPDMNLSIMTGPVLNVGFSDDYYLTSKPVAGHRFHASGTAYGDNGFLNRVDCAWRIGVGMTISHDWFVGVSGDLGMCNMLKEDAGGNVSFRENAVHVTLGYNF